MASVSLSPHERSLRARIGAHTLHSTHDPTETTSKARAAFLARFEDEVDPDRVLPEAERARRAEHARKAHMARLALASVRARRSAAAPDQERSHSPPVAAGAINAYRLDKQL